MKKRTRNLVICILALIILGGAYFTYELLTRPEIDDYPEIVNNNDTGIIRLVSPDPFGSGEAERNRRWIDALSLTINVQGEETIYLRPNFRGDWFSVTRAHLPLEQESVSLWLMAFAMLSATEVLVENPSTQMKAEFELYPARAAVTVQYNDGAVYTAYIGAQTADGRYHYIMMQGDPNIYLIGSFDVRWFFNGYDMIIYRELPMLNPSAIVAIQVNQRGMPPVDIQILESHIFSDFPDFFEEVGLGMLSPIHGAPVSIHGVEYALLNHINNFANPHQGELFINLVEINPQDLSIYGLDEPRLEIIIEMEDGFIYHLKVGDNTATGMGGEAYAMFNGLDGVWIARNILLFPIYDLNPFDMIFNFLSFMELRNVARVELGLASGYLDALIEHSFEPPQSEWENERHVIDVTVNGEVISDPAFRRFFREVLSLTRQNVTETPHAPQGQPLEWIKYHMNDGTTILHEFHHYNAAFYGVSTNGGDITYLLSRHSMSELNRYAYMMMNRQGVFNR